MNQQTRDNLMSALQAEALAFCKYMMFAKKARETGRHDLAKLFTEIANVELSDHFSAEAELIGLVGDNKANIAAALSGEIQDVDVMYRQFIEQALDAGEQEIADRFMEIRRDEIKHRDSFMSALEKEKEKP